MSATTTYNLADLFEQAVDQWPDRLYVVDERSRRTYAELEARANQLAHYMASRGVGVGDHVGIYAYNCVEWVETLWAVFKLRAVWININYRYVTDELAYLFANAGLSFLVVQPEFVAQAQAVQPDLPMLIMGAEYETAIATESKQRDFAPRSNDDQYILFTGGTTGMPKGVVWRHEDVLMALGGGIDIRSGEKVSEPTDFIPKGNTGFSMVTYPLPPLMHGASQWSVMGQSFVGNSTVLREKFDARVVWNTIASEKANLIMITGDAMARPLLDTWKEMTMAHEAPDVSSLFAISSSAVLFSQTCKDEFLDNFPNLVITDAIGSSESGANGITMVSKGTKMQGGPTVTASRDAVVLDEDLRPMIAGTNKIGRLARFGNIPIGYLNDPEKTAETFVVGADGVRYVIPGDFAQLESDGSITMLGRGSVSINTGGEKVFPEEVENSLKSHGAIFDAVVVGIPDDRWGELVTALVRVRPGIALTLEDLQAHCRQHIAGYKVPRALVLVSDIVRSPAGKPDYRWAKKHAIESVAKGQAS
ncbi:MAG: acyl-CoA synthetase [Ilumatobacteraceae bacterium]|nr:acyl-CoA synthetase [Ilumatobacteraceae bacterium]